MLREPARSAPCWLRPKKVEPPATELLFQRLGLLCAFSKLSAGFLNWVRHPRVQDLGLIGLSFRV